MQFGFTQTPQPAELDEQLLLGRYRVLGEAGAGGFGTVHMAWDTRMQRRVAVKSMDLNGMVPDGQVIDSVDQLPDYALSGLDEARTAAMLAHANIVTVHDFEVRDNCAYLIMEYVDGMTLTDLLHVVGDNITIDMVTAVFDGVAAALEFAHENQVLHLDIKPDNVMIDHQGQVKVMDFGLARLSGAQGFSSAAGGTIGYMPPEQIMREALDVRCDEWALASLTYEMISGGNPFLARDLSSAIDRIEGAEIVLPSLCMEGLPRGIDDVLFFALDPDRFERYATVEDFAEEMDRFLGSAPAGRKQLSTAVSSSMDDGTGAAEFTGGRISPGASRLARFLPAIALRAMSAANVGVLAYAGVSAIPALGGWNDPLSWGSTLAAAAIAAIVPRFGSILGVAVLVAALLSCQAYVLAAALGAAGLAWWMAVGRTADAHSVGGLAVGSVGALGMNQLAPVLCALLMGPGKAAVNALFAGGVAFVLAACGSQSLIGWDAPIGLVDGNAVQQHALALAANPSTWVAVASWLLAAPLGAVLCRKRTLAWQVAGISLSGAVLVAGAFVVGWVDSEFATWATPSLAYLVPAVVSAALCLLVAFVWHRLDQEGAIVRSLHD